jgi:hypothetical protein
MCSEEHGKSKGPLLTHHVVEIIGEQPTFLAIEAPVSGEDKQYEKEHGTVPPLDVQGLIAYEQTMASIYSAITTELESRELTPRDLYNHLTSRDFADSIKTRIPKFCGDQFSRISNIGQELARATNDSTTPEDIVNITTCKSDYHEANAELYSHCYEKNIPVYAVDKEFRAARSDQEVYDQASERNKIMASRIEAILKTTGLKSAVFLGGSAHIPEMSYILSSSTVKVNEFLATDRKELNKMLVRIYGEGSAMLGTSAAHSESSGVSLPPIPEASSVDNSSADASSSGTSTSHSSRAKESKRSTSTSRQ